jgi:ArsR family transcriptional regulator
MRYYKAELFKTLAHPQRIRILDELRDGERNVGQLQRTLESEQSNISQHLAALRNKGLVNARRDGTSMWYSVNDRALWEILDIAKEIYKRNLQAQQAQFENAQ